MALHLITGGSGYVGSHIARRLLELDEDVRVIDLWCDLETDQRIEFFQGDITKTEDINKALVGVDYVHHTAALVPLTKAGNNFEKVNYIGTKNVINASLENNVRHIAHMSSSAIYGIPKTVPINDKTKLEPLEVYGRSKKKADDYVTNLISSGKPISTIRPRTIIGKERLGIFEILFEWIHDQANIFIIGKGDGLFQFVHVKDLIEISIKSCLMEKPGVFNVGAEEYGTLREDLNSLITYANSSSKVIGLPVSITIFLLKTLDLLRLSPLGPWHYLTYHKPFYFDITQTKNVLNWTPKYSNKDILTESYEWYVNNIDEFSFDNNPQIRGSMHRKPLRKGLLRLAKQISRIF